MSGKQWRYCVSEPKTRPAHAPHGPPPPATGRHRAQHGISGNVRTRLELEVDHAALCLSFGWQLFLLHNFELSIERCGDVTENSVELFDVVRPPCGWSRDQNCGHVTKQAAAGRRWQPGRRTTRSDQGHAAGREGQNRDPEGLCWTSDPNAHRHPCDSPPENMFATDSPRPIGLVCPC